MSQPIPGSIRSKFNPIIQDIIEKLKVDFVEPGYLYKRTGRALPREVHGTWDVIGDLISVNTGMSFLGTKSDVNHTFLHELIHWTGHTKRLSRPLIVEALQSDGFYAPKEHELHTEEATAELGALKLGKALGLNIESAEALALAYLHRQTKADMVQANRDADKAVSYIIQQLNKF